MCARVNTVGRPVQKVATAVVLDGLYSRQQQQRQLFFEDQLDSVLKKDDTVCLRLFVRGVQIDATHQPAQYQDS